MPNQTVSRRRAKVFSSALFLFGLAFLVYFDSWWPAIMLVIGVPLALRQLLLGRYYDMLLSLIVFGGVYFTAQFDFSWKVLLPVVLVISALYLLIREFTDSKTPSEDEIEEDLNHEIEETQDEEHHKK